MLLGAIAVVMLAVTELPTGSSPTSVSVPYFPDRLHAFVWRNWQAVPVDRLAETVAARPEEIIAIGHAMGLSGPPTISEDQLRRSHITIIKRNWHILPYEQLLKLLRWTPEQLAYTLREDDFLFIKLGSLKPKCETLVYTPPDEKAVAREKEIAEVVHAQFSDGIGLFGDPLFSFVKALSSPPESQQKTDAVESLFSPRYCYSYFGLYGDPLMEPDADPYPDGYLARLAQAGVNGVWLQGVLYKLSPFPWDPSLSAGYEQRLIHLRTLVEKAKKHGIGVYLYLNEPRAMPLSFYDAHPDMKGVVEGDHAALCTSSPEVKQYIETAVSSICTAAPDLAGLFTISGSENLSNCWSHGQGAGCPRCGKRTASEVIAEFNSVVQGGINTSGSSTRLIAWDWGWADDWVQDIIQRLPQQVALMSVSEWNLPIQRGGINGTIGEYSISAIGPGPRATKHWQWARDRGLKTIAKIQANNTWELSAVPYIPAVYNVAQHAANLRTSGVSGVMLGWTLGGYPSPNLEVVAELGRTSTASPEQALLTVAQRRFGNDAAPAVVEAWKQMSEAFSEFPFSGGTVYSAPLQVGPANPLWLEPTGYSASMVGFAYDDVDAWRQIYPADIFAAQLDKVGVGFDHAVDALTRAVEQSSFTDEQRERFSGECRVARAAAIHFRSVANQVRFNVARNAAQSESDATKRQPLMTQLENVLKDELRLARAHYDIQMADSRIGFEASNQYYYVPLDLAEKVINCEYLLRSLAR